MNILPALLKKYPFNVLTSQIIVGNIFYHLDSIENPRQALFVYDTNILEIIDTYKPAGIISFNLENPKARPTFENVAKIIHSIKKFNINHIFGFGTGSINDICKYATFLAGIHYTFCPTAFSMNGIISQNVSLVHYQSRIKKSINAKPANVILIEEDIIMNADKKFINSAIMDSLAAYTACNDFIFASQLDYKLYPFEKQIFQIFHKEMLNIIKIINNNVNALYTDFKTAMQVFEILYLSGCIMNYYGSSIAFSGGEHHIAHTLESKFPTISDQFLHGEVISAILPFYSDLQLNYSGNYYVSQNIINKNIFINFIEIAKKLKMPTNPQDIGVSIPDFMNCVKNAKHAKTRPTILSLLF